MDTIGLLAAWVGIISSLVAALVAISAHLVAVSYRFLVARSSKARTQERLDKLLLDLNAAGQTLDNTYLADLVSLYGSMMLNLVAAIGLVMISIEVLDLGPAL